jgi:hypothetical protein
MLLRGRGVGPTVGHWPQASAPPTRRRSLARLPYRTCAAGLLRVRHPAWRCGPTARGSRRSGPAHSPKPHTSCCLTLLLRSTAAAASMHPRTGGASPLTPQISRPPSCIPSTVCPAPSCRSSPSTRRTMTCCFTPPSSSPQRHASFCSHMTAKQRAVDGAEPKQLLYAQHVHCAGRGSLRVLLMVSVEGACGGHQCCRRRVARGVHGADGRRSTRRCRWGVAAEQCVRSPWGVGRQRWRCPSCWLYREEKGEGEGEGKLPWAKLSFCPPLNRC